MTVRMELTKFSNWLLTPGSSPNAGAVAGPTKISSNIMVMCIITNNLYLSDLEVNQRT